MNDEQTTIYISPEDDLTNVRERLERLPNRRVVLVIPTQTQLRSHVAWKLLHARARELGKEVVIVSTDPQIRSVAQAVKFKVAHSLEASPTGKSRPPSRPGRAAPGPRNRDARPSTSLPRPYGNKSAGSGRNVAHPSRQLAPLDQWSPTTERPQTQPEQEDYDSALPGHNQSVYGKSFDYSIDTSPPIRPLPDHVEDEEPDLLIEDIEKARSIREAASRPPEYSSQVPHEESPALYESAQEYRMTPRPPEIEEDPFASMEDVVPPSRAEQRAGIPMNSFETQQYPIQDIPHEPVVEDTHGTLEYQGDQGDFVVREGDQSGYFWAEPAAEEEQDTAGPARVYGMRPRTSRGSRGAPQPPQPTPDLDNDDALPPVDEAPTRVIPPMSARVPSQPIGQQRPSSKPLAPRQPSKPLAQRPSSQQLSARQAVPQQPRTSRPLDSRRSSQPLAGQGQRSASQPLSQSRISKSLSGQAGTASVGTRDPNRNPVSQQRPRPAGPTSQSLTRQQPGRTGSMRPVGAAAAPATQQRAKPKSRSRFGGYGIAITLIALLLILGLLVFTVPSASVDVTLASQNYPATLKLTARPNQSKDVPAGIVPAELLTQSFTANGSGQATGNTKVQRGSATGLVTFTNNGTQAVIIPSGTVITADNGAEFVTTEEASVSTKADANVGNTMLIAVQAKTKGDTGNVRAGTITKIPQESLSAIASANQVQASTLKLEVTNEKATSGGGATEVPAATKQDLDTIQQALTKNKNLQNDVSNWLKQQQGPGDVLGKSTSEATLEKAPKVGSALEERTFAATLRLTVSVLVVRNAALQEATIQQLNTQINKDTRYKNFTVVSQGQQPVVIDRKKLKVSSNGTKDLTLNFPVQGKIVPALDKATVVSLIAGKAPADVQRILQNNIGNGYVQTAKVNVNPSFIPWVPYWSERIQVTFIPGDPPKK